MTTSTIVRVLTAPARWADRLAMIAAAAGPGSFAWPILIGLGLGLGVLGLWEEGFARLVLQRRATTEFMKPAVIAIASGVGLTTIGLAVTPWIHRRRGGTSSAVEVIRRWCYRFAAVSTLPLVVAMRAPMEGEFPRLTLAFAVVAGVLTAFSAYHWMRDLGPDAKEWRYSNRLAITALTGFIVIYCIALSYLSVSNHIAFNTGLSDLGYYVNIFRQSSVGIPLGCSLCGQGTHYAGGHFDPILVLLSPLYRLYPFAESILVLQTAWLAVGAVPVYLLTRHKTGSSAVSAMLAVSYLMYPALHGVNLFDFHSLALCVPLLLFLLYFLQIGATKRYLVTMLLVLLVREDMPIALAFVGVFAIFSKIEGSARLGWVTIGSAILYFLVAKFVVIGRPDPLNTAQGARGYAYFFEELIPKGLSTSGLVGTLIANPVYSLSVVVTETKLNYLAKLLAPLLLLPLAGRGRVTLIYGLALTLLASRRFLHSTHFQYSSALIPFLFFLTADALGRVRWGSSKLLADLGGGRVVRALAIGILTCTALSSWKFGGVVPNSVFKGGFRSLQVPNDKEREKAARIKDTTRALPAGASVAANSRVVPHLGNVTTVYMIDKRFEADYVITTAYDSKRARRDAREMKKEVRRGELTEIDRFHNVRVFETNYRGETIAKARKAREKAVKRRQARNERNKGNLDSTGRRAKRTPKKRKPTRSSPAPEASAGEDGS